MIGGSLAYPVAAALVGSAALFTGSKATASPAKVSRLAALAGEKIGASAAELGRRPPSRPSGGNSATFRDPAGDGGAAPDVRTLQVSNDRRGVVTFRVTLGDRQELREGEIVYVLVDADEKLGVDYSLVVVRDQGKNLFGVLDARKNYAETSIPSFRGAFSSSAVRFTVAQRDIGGANRFVKLIAASGAGDAEDVLPDSRFVTYQVRTANSVTYADGTGDTNAGVGPDIRNIRISNDKRGKLTFRVLLANRTTLGENDTVWVTIDRDRDRTTAPFGYEYSMGVSGRANTRPRFVRWNGTTMVAPRARSFSARSVGPAIVFTVHRGDLGGALKFDFLAGASTTSGTEAGNALQDFDYVPGDKGQAYNATYDVKGLARPKRPRR